MLDYFCYYYHCYLGKMDYKVVESQPRVSTASSSQASSSSFDVPSKAIPVAKIKTPTKQPHIQIVALKPSPLKQQLTGGSHLLNAVQQRIPVTAVPVSLHQGQSGQPTQVVYYTTSATTTTAEGNAGQVQRFNMQPGQRAISFQARLPAGNTITLTRPAVVSTTPLIALAPAQVVSTSHSNGGNYSATISSSTVTATPLPASQGHAAASNLVAPPHSSHPPVSMLRTVSALQGHPGQPTTWRPSTTHWSPPNHQMMSSQHQALRQTQNQAAPTVSIELDTEETGSQSKLNASGDGNKKPCHCNKSQCLKLYCECFAAGEFCSNCNCQNCANNLEHEDERNKAIKQCLERNPTAFHPKIMKSMAGKELIGERRQTRGCNCKRSGCWKNYCECYEAKVACTSACKCIGCRNCPEAQRGQLTSLNLSSGDPLAPLGSSAGHHGHHSTTHHVHSTAAGGHLGSHGHHARGSQQQTHVGTLYDRQLNKQLATKSRLAIHHHYQKQPSQSSGSIKLPHKLFTPEVIEATCACLLAVADETSAENHPSRQQLQQHVGDPVFTERAVLEEFGRCLAQIIEVAYRPITSGVSPGTSS